MRKLVRPVVTSVIAAAVLVSGALAANAQERRPAPGQDRMNRMGPVGRGTCGMSEAQCRRPCHGPNRIGKVGPGGEGIRGLHGTINPVRMREMKVQRARGRTGLYRRGPEGQASCLDGHRGRGRHAHREVHGRSSRFSPPDGPGEGRFDAGDRVRGHSKRGYRGQTEGFPRRRDKEGRRVREGGRGVARSADASAGS
jgi:hypothetical protein